MHIIIVLLFCVGVNNDNSSFFQSIIEPQYTSWVIQEYDYLSKFSIKSYSLDKMS